MDPSTPLLRSTVSRYWRDERLGGTRWREFTGDIRSEPQTYSGHAFAAVVEGAISVRCSDRQFVANPGDVICIASNVLCQLESLGGRETSVSSVFVPVGYAQTLLERTTPACVAPARLLRSPTLHGHLLRLVHEARHAAAGLAQYDRRRDDLAMLLADAAATEDQPVEAIARRAPSEPMIRARAFIESHAAQPLALSSVARLCEVSESWLVRAFRETYWLTPHQWLVSLRTRNGREALDGGLSVTDAAAHSGFADQSHFSRWFKRAYGMSPGMYRAAVHPR